MNSRMNDGSGELAQEPTLELRDLSAWYGQFLAIKNISLSIPKRRITSIIGPSGCGKSTLVRCLNRMHELVPGARVEGTVLLDGEDIYQPGVDPVDLRSRIGMVFQKPNPFPKSIYENVAFGLRVNGYNENIGERVQRALERAALWGEVKDRLKEPALGLSGGQQQRLCIARAVAVEPAGILMDEPCSALDPLATLAIEDLVQELAKEYRIVIVTHNMQQAARVSNLTAMMMMNEDRVGELVEWGPTGEIFTNPRDQRTQDYITGRIG